MKFVINKEKSILSFDFEGFTYVFPNSDSVVKINEKLYDHLKEIVPLAFDFEPEIDKKAAILEPTVTATKSMFRGANFGIKSEHLVDPGEDLPKNGASDKDGTEWYGPGLEDDTP